MKLTQLEYFVTAAKYNNITKAAKKLFVSQPAISLAIKDLENKFNTALFYRNNNVLELTKEGRQLLELAKPLLLHKKRVETEMFEYLRKNEVVHIGIPPMLGTFLLPKITKQFSKYHPNVQMEIQEYGSQTNQLAVESGEIDISLTVIYNDNKLPTLEYLPISKTYLRLAVHKSSNLANKEKISFEDIKDIPLILMNDETLQAKIVKEEFKKRNIKPNIRVRSNQIYTIRSIIEQSHMAAFAFDKIFENDDDIVLIPFDTDFILEIVLCYRKNAELNKLTKEFIDFVSSTLMI